MDNSLWTFLVVPNKLLIKNPHQCDEFGVMYDCCTLSNAIENTIPSLSQSFRFYIVLVI